MVNFGSRRREADGRDESSVLTRMREGEGKLVESKCLV
jgi:hypothetical protein